VICYQVAGTDGWMSEGLSQGESEGAVASCDQSLNNVIMAGILPLNDCVIYCIQY
jgi:hypothetical protein